jgi:hypothetical protein
VDPENNNNIMKILCFTTSYRRPYYLYNTINNILNQTYKNIQYCVNINIDNDSDKELYNRLLSDFSGDKRLKLIFNQNSDQQKNYIRAIEGFGHTNYDLFFKIDDDDIYLKKYIEQSISFYNKYKVDIISYISSNHINNNILKNQEMKNIGFWQPDAQSTIQFGMPPTFIFNKKACDIILKIDSNEAKKIHIFEDGAWKTYWRKNNLSSKIIEDEYLFIYNIHNNNTSSKFLLDKQYSTIENQHFIITIFEHSDWNSYVYLNKRNNRIYNINNNDHGSYTIKHNSLIIVDWDDWGKEKYLKKSMSQTTYKYIFKKKL